MAAFLIELTWSHVHFPTALYISGFYREMAPNWLDLPALVKGHRPTHREEGPFRYLELGSGMGLHLCLLAAAYPEGSLVLVDAETEGSQSHPADALGGGGGCWPHSSGGSPSTTSSMLPPPSWPQPPNSAIHHC